MERKEYQRIEPKFDDEAYIAHPPQLSKKRIQVSKIFFKTLIYLILIPLAAFLSFLSWEVLKVAAIEKQLSFYLYKLGALEDRKQAEANAIRCWEAKNLSCANNYLNFLKKEAEENPRLIAIKGGILAGKGKNKEAAEYLNEIAYKISLNNEIVYQLCLTNSGASFHEKAIDWCNVASKTERAPSSRNLNVIRAFSSSLIEMNRYAEALTLLQDHDQRQARLGQAQHFISDRIYIEERLREAPARKRILAYKDNSSDRFETVVRIGEMSYQRFIIDTGANGDLTVSPDSFDPSLAKSRFLRRATARGFNGSEDHGTLLNVQEIYVGGIKFQNVTVYLCGKKCSNLMGIGLLDRFRVQIDRLNGESVMSLEVK